MKAQIQIDGNPYQITIQKVLTFQLDEDAKAKAHENLMGTAHCDWWDNVYSMIADDLHFVGFDADRKSFQFNLDRGEGFAFDGNWSLDRRTRESFRSLTNADKAQSFAKVLDEIQGRHDAELIIQVTGRVDFSRPFIEVESELDGDDELTDADASLIDRTLRNLCSRYLAMLREESEHLESVDYVKEVIETNGYRFDMNGHLI